MFDRMYKVKVVWVAKTAKLVQKRVKNIILNKTAMPLRGEMKRCHVRKEVWLFGTRGETMAYRGRGAEKHNRQTSNQIMTRNFGF